MSIFRKPSCPEAFISGVFAAIFTAILTCVLSHHRAVNPYLNPHYAQAQVHNVFFVAIFSMTLGVLMSGLLGFLYLRGTRDCFVRQKILIWSQVLFTSGNVVSANIILMTQNATHLCHFHFSWISLIFLLPLFVGITKKWLPKERTSLSQVAVTFLMSPVLLLLSLFTKIE